MDRYEIYAKMIEKYGFEKQMLIAVEECSELQKDHILRTVTKSASASN